MCQRGRSAQLYLSTVGIERQGLFFWNPIDSKFIIGQHCRPERRLSEGEARWFFQQIVVGLDYCHSRGVANRDLKLENLLLDSVNPAQPILKMCDFGYSKVRLLVFIGCLCQFCLRASFSTCSMSSTASQRRVLGPCATWLQRCTWATQRMMPRSGHCFDLRRLVCFKVAVSLWTKSVCAYALQVADIWSVGIILFAMLFGAFPFKGRDKRYIQAVLLGRYAVPPDVPVRSGGGACIAKHEC